MGRLGRLRASSTAVLVDSLLRAAASSARIAVSLSSVVGPRLRVVSEPAL